MTAKRWIDSCKMCGCNLITTAEEHPKVTGIKSTCHNCKLKLRFVEAVEKIAEAVCTIGGRGEE